MELVGLLDNNKNKGNKKMSATRSNPQVVTVSDPTVARQLARTVAQEQATGSTNPVVVTNTETLFNQATASAANAAPGQTSTLTVTSSPANDVGDVVTVYRTTGGITVTAVNETVNQYTSVDSGVSQILAGTGVTITSTGASGTGVVTINAGNVGLGNISSINLNGNVNSVLRGDGTWGADANSSYGNSNVVSLLASFGSNTITTTGNVSVGNISATNLGNIAATNYDGNAANVLHGDGTWSADVTDYGNSNVANYLPTYTGNISSGNAALGNLITANYANIAFDVNANVVNANFLYGDGSNITNLPVGNIATINLDGNASNALLGDGTFGPVEVTGSSIANGSSNITIPAANGNITLNAGSGQWLFDTAGRIEFPGGTAELTSAANYFGLWANGAANTNGIEFTVGNNAFLSTDGSFQLDTNVANGVYSFVFKDDGSLIFPNNSNIYPAGNNFNVYAPATGAVQFYTDGGNFNWSLDGYGVMNLPFASALSNTSIVYSAGNFRIDAGANNFVFTDTGLLTMPGGNVSIGLQYGSEAILASNTSFGVATQGANVTTFINWSDDVANTSVMSAIYVNAPNANPGDIHFRVGNVGSPNFWQFNVDGNLVLPNGNSVIYSIANSSLDPTLPNVSTMTLTPDANYNSQVLVLDPTAPGHIHLRAHAFSNIDDPSANIFLGGEATSFEITQGANNQAVIHSNNYTWTFGNDGNLTLPGGYTIGEPGGPTLEISAPNTTNAIMLRWANEVSLTLGNTGAANIAQIGTAGGTWDFDETGTLTIPGNLVANGASPAPTLSGFSSLTAADSITVGNANIYSNGHFAADTASFTGNISALNIGNAAGVALDGNISNVLTGNGTFVALPVINANTVVWSTAPVANTSNGSAGQAAYDSGGNLYVCVATDTWAKFTGTTSW